MDAVISLKIVIVLRPIDDKRVSCEMAIQQDILIPFDASVQRGQEFVLDSLVVSLPRNFNPPAANS